MKHLIIAMLLVLCFSAALAEVVSVTQDKDGKVKVVSQATTMTTKEELLDRLDSFRKKLADLKLSQKAIEREIKAIEDILKKVK